MIVFLYTFNRCWRKIIRGR